MLLMVHGHMRRHLLPRLPQLPLASDVPAVRERSTGDSDKVTTNLWPSLDMMLAGEYYGSMLNKPKLRFHRCGVALEIILFSDFSVAESFCFSSFMTKQQPL